VIDHVRHANAYGLDGMVITDHGSNQHVKIGVENVNPEILAARREVRDTLVFQGLEWNNPAAEHGTVFVHPGRDEVSLLKQFENDHDGSVRGAAANTAANEALAIAGLHFLADSVDARRVNDALMFANHPARKGIDSRTRSAGAATPRRESRSAWRARPGTRRPASRRRSDRGRPGFYDNSPDPTASFPGYPLRATGRTAGSTG
jgi:hypothetical protein